MYSLFLPILNSGHRLGLHFWNHFSNIAVYSMTWQTKYRQNSETIIWKFSTLEKLLEVRICSSSGKRWVIFLFPLIKLNTKQSDWTFQKEQFTFEVTTNLRETLIWPGGGAEEEEELLSALSSIITWISLSERKSNHETFSKNQKSERRFKKMWYLEMSKSTVVILFLETSFKILFSDFWTIVNDNLFKMTRFSQSLFNDLISNTSCQEIQDIFQQIIKTLIRIFVLWKTKKINKRNITYQIVGSKKEWGLGSDLVVKEAH